MMDQDDPDIGSDERAPAANGGGRSFWGGLRAALFGDGEGSTLRDQIEEAIDESESEAPKLGDLTHVERQMLRNMLHFGEKTAGDVAVPRGDIIAVDSNISFAELVAAFADAGHSRLPIFEGSLDRVVGMIHLKDVFARMVGGEDPPEDIMALVREPLYVPESMGMPDLLASMRAQRIHLAIVVDEFGGTEGLVTIEDVVEEITGDIEDEHDEEPEGALIPLENGMWDADARAELDDVAQTVDPRLAEVEEDVDTLGGLAVVLAGHMPQQGEVVEHPSGWRLEVTQCEPRRVTRLRLHPPQDADAAA
jgi:CBS domain containing-hemolysin-like protein